MKLRNKKTGEIINNNGINFSEGNYKTYNSIAEFNEEWEDYEEPKNFWYMTSWGDVHEYSERQFAIKQKQAIGNYFESKEEAEKAVGKLKAWKRLKDGGFRFNGGDDACISYRIDPAKWNDKLDNDFDLIFGGEE